MTCTTGTFSLASRNSPGAASMSGTSSCSADAVVVVGGGGGGADASSPILIKTLAGKVLSVSCTPGEGAISVGCLKDAILELEGIPTDQLRLIGNGKLMADDDDLVLPGTRVHLVLRLRGGCGDRFRITRSLTSGGVRLEVLRLFVNQAEFWNRGGPRDSDDRVDVSVPDGPGVRQGDAAMLHSIATPLDLGDAPAIAVRLLPSDGTWKESVLKLPPPEIGTPIAGSVTISVQDGPLAIDGSAFGKPIPPSPDSRPALYRRLVAEFKPSAAPFGDDDLLYMDATPFLKAVLGRLTESLGAYREHVSFDWNARIGGRRSAWNEDIFNN